MSHPTEDKNFRLPTTVRPTRYAPTVTLDFEKKGFTAQMDLSLTLAQPAKEIVLHAVELELTSVQAEVGGKTLTGSARLVPVSGTAVLTFPTELPAGAATLRLGWKGKFNTGLRGLYFAAGVAATQFEAADARRLFPCFDEPPFKARWAITARFPKGLAALSNGRPVQDQVEGPLRKVVFAETELLSSYLIALVCGPLEGTPEQKVGEIPVRTWAVKEKLALTAFGQNAALEALPRLQTYFGLPYAFGKVDQVGIPEFEAGAMENAGLITYRETALLLDPAAAPLSVKKRVAEVVTHELSHQWFGNWVTMAWWDDLWLNEAFATWMAYKIVDGWQPAWRVWLDFDVGRAAALQLDALRSTHPIRGVVRNADEAGESFDLITYEKGGSVLRMIEGFLGEGPFREGIRLYMKRHARANAVADDLWAALAEASAQPVVELANAWIGQSGYPVLSVAVKGRDLKVSQRRFYSEPGLSSEETWPVPLVIRYGHGKEAREERFLMRGREATFTLAAEPSWLCANGGSSGFYRVQYDEPALQKLTQHLGELKPAERIALLSDRWALVRSGDVSIKAFLDLCSGFGGEQDDAVLDELGTRLRYIEHRLVANEELPRYREFVAGLMGPQLKKVGWDAASSETDEQRLRRAALVRLVGVLARAPEVVSEARNRVQAQLSGKAALEPNLLDPAFSIAARAGDAGLFDALVAKFPKEAEPASKVRYLLALTTFEDVQLNHRAQEMFLRGEVPMQDTAAFVAGLLGNRTGADSFWRAMRESWDKVLERTGRAPMLLRRVVEAMGQLKDRRHLEEVTAFLKAHPMDEVKQAVSQTLERLTQDVALKERVEKDVSAWIRR